MGLILEYVEGQTPRKGETRKKYLEAIYNADKGNIQPLMDFSRT
jgi:hypothetical protein